MTEMIAKYSSVFAAGFGETLYMTFFSAAFAYIVGLPLGVAMFVTKPGGIAESKKFNAGFGWFINIIRSIPFIILLVVIMPLTRLIAGSVITAKAAVIPLVVSAAPFVSRMVEQSLEEIDYGTVEAAKCMGATNMQIVAKVLVPESVPGIIRGMSITTITLIGYGAIAGAIGSGGLGSIAIRYGLHRFQPDVMYITLFILIAMVCLVQSGFETAARKVDKRNK